MNRFALIYQLSKPIVKKTAMHTSIPDVSGIKTTSKDKESSGDKSGPG